MQKKENACGGQQYGDVPDGRPGSQSAQGPAGMDFRPIVENRYEGIWIIDRKAVTTFVNRRMADLLKYSAGEMIGKPLYFFMEKNDAAVAAALLKQREQSIGEDREFMFIKKGGGKVCTNFSARLLFDSSGDHIGAIISALDITEHKQTERMLQENEERFSSLFYNSTIGIYRTTPDGQIIMANPALVHMLGFETFEELAMRNLEHEGYEPQYQREEFIARIGHTGEIRGLESVWKRKDGVALYVRENARLVREKQGGRIYYEGTIEDITESKKAAEALKISERRFRVLVENAFDGVSVIGGSGAITYESPGINRLLGYKPEERLGVRGFENIYPDDIERAQDAFRKIAARPEETFLMDLRVRRKDGAWRWFECAGRNLLDDPVVKGIVINYRDITERKLAEEKRAKLEQQIRQAQKLESLGVLAGGIAHDFNNLLSGIFGSIEIARAAADEPRVSQTLETAMSAIDRARGLTRQLLTFAKGGVPVTRAGELFPFVEETARFALSGSNVSCRFDIPQTLWPCDFDKSQIGQAVENVVINAQQAMPMGGVIELSAANVSFMAREHTVLPGGRYVQISVKDCGIGIPREILPRIFDPFFTTKQKGSGLGLAISYSIITRHGGAIDVASEPGHGSTFTLYLPAAEKSCAAAAAGTASVFKGSGRLLIADDDDIVRVTMSKLCTVLGYTAECTKDGKEALDFFIQESRAGRPFDGIILDLTIPAGMGGKEAVAAIRKLNADIPVFVASGYSEDPVIANPAAYGFTASLRKPFNIAELSEMLHRYVKGNHANNRNVES